MTRVVPRQRSSRPIDPGVDIGPVHLEHLAFSGRRLDLQGLRAEGLDSKATHS
jgi:hypothetical protein